MQLILDQLPPSLHQQREVLGRCLRAFDESLPTQQIYLFGSHLRGEANEHSDIDLCIVADGVTDQLAAAQVLRRATRDIRPKPPFTLIPISPERLLEKQARHDPFFTTILEEGLLIAKD